MKYKEQPIDRLRKLAIIYQNSNSFYEYKCKADLDNVNRNNYLFFFDPFFFYWIVKNYGEWTRYMIGIGSLIISFLIGWIFFSINPILIAISGIFGCFVLGCFDYGRKIASKFLYN